MEASTYKTDGEHTSVGARLKAWEYSIELIGKSPWLGHGVGSYKAKALQNFESISVCKLGICDQPHNQFITTVTETGVIGILGLFVWMLSPFTHLRKAATRGIADHKNLLSPLMVIFLITAMFDSSLKIQGQLFFMVIKLGLISCAVKNSQSDGASAVPIN
ncbi:O-antigen ligase [Limnohabitans sp. Bal53]|uniref:O-antigen ligase family protein n=1 Tax=Limnohabitans sp. Bal53 TaxID=1977910 RepID=UPI000D34068D|nr:O-antigen ligase family protein [Limnohabitans sp. Bal53]PUE42356.1 hypothetical protein B9Z50_00310 [Limnohabitans sp. Bal53]